jgi:hypothetical protein
MIKDGSVTLMDYIFDTKNVARSVSGLTKLGFFDEFEIGHVTSNVIGPGQFKPATINYQKGNLNNDPCFKFWPQEFDCIDATLSIHHATPYQRDLDAVVSGIYGILKKGGMFHFGTGNVDMKYSEKKINKIAGDFYQTIGSPVNVIDARNEGFEKKMAFADGKWQGPNAGYTNVHISKEGTISVGTYGNKQTKPLIDPDNEEDYKGLVLPVDTYYGHLQAKADKGLEKGLIDKELHESVSKAIDFERQNARKGIVEYFSGEEMILQSLEKAGFKVEEVKHHEQEPFYNIVAIKKKKK